MQLKNATRNWHIIASQFIPKSFQYFRPAVNNPGMMEVFGTHACDTCGKQMMAPNEIMVDCTKEFLESKKLIDASPMVIGECLNINGEGETSCDQCFNNDEPGVK